MILAAWCIILLPIVPLVLALRARDAGAAPEARLLLALTAASWLWLVVGLFVRDAIGPDYSARRFATIQANLAVLALVAIWAAFGRRRLGRYPWLAALAAALAWAYLIVVSSAV